MALYLIFIKQLKQGIVVTINMGINTDIIIVGYSDDKVSPIQK